MTRREVVLGDVILVRSDPALAVMRDAGLFHDLAGHHARLHGEQVRGAVVAEWIGPSTVQICYDSYDPACDHSSPRPAPQVGRTA